MLSSGEKRMWFSEDKMTDCVQRVLMLRAQEGKRKPDDYDFLKRYDVLELASVKKLVRAATTADNPKFYVALGDVFHVIREAHVACGHGGEKRTEKELAKKYVNVTREQIKLYLSMCENCQLKKCKTNKGVVVKPMLSQTFCSRGQVDLIDFQSQADKQYRFILNYQDHFTKYCILRPLTSKRASAIAYQLIDIFTTLGAPRILQSDNGREFVACVIEELKVMWPDLVIVHGKPRHPQSQGSVERANGDVEDMLRSWLNGNKTTEWALGLKFVQLQKNTAVNRVMKTSPYRALFGQDPSIGLKSDFPNDVLTSVRLECEEDLERLLSTTGGEENADSEAPMDEAAERDRSPTVVAGEDNYNVETHNDEQPTTETALTILEFLGNGGDAAPHEAHEENAVDCLSWQTEKPSGEVFDSSTVTSESQYCCCGICHETVDVGILCDECKVLIHEGCSQKNPNASGSDSGGSVCLRCSSNSLKETIHVEVRCHQKRAATNMLESAKKTLKTAELHDTVRIPIPQVDRAKTEHRNLLGLIVDNDNGLFQVQTKEGLLSTRFCRNQFELCDRSLLTVEDMPPADSVPRLTVREAAISGSQGHGQGFQKCTCKCDCKTQRYKCRKNRVHCNSHCHSKNSKCLNH